MLRQRNSKKQGDVGLAYAIAYYASQGFTVSFPLTASQDYDLVVDNGRKLQRVQVKTTTYQRGACYEVNLRVSGVPVHN